MGQCSNRGWADANEEFFPTASVSLEKAKSLSSNAAVTAARYHYSHAGEKLTDDYTVDGKVLGQGLCGDVVLASGKIDKKKYALKRIKKQGVVARKVQQLTAEVEIYLSLDHPNIARLHDVYETDVDILLLSECCSGGELYFRLQKCGVYTDADAADATRQMLRAVGHLHSRSVVHRDLKLENFLYQSDEPSSLLKLIDFGFAKIWDPSTPMMASCGSIAYVSPDVLCGRGYTNKCDLWSLGVIVWMLLAGYPPFHGDEKIMVRKIKAGDADWCHKSRWKPVTEDAIDFVQRLLCKDVSKRLDAREALQHPFVARPTAVGNPVALSRESLRSLQRYADASRVRRAVLQLLAQELDVEETQELRETFLSIDKSNEGTICLRDLKDAVRNGAANSPTKRRRKPEVLACNNTGHPGFGLPNLLTGPSTPQGSTLSAMSPLGSGMSECGSPTTPARTLRRAPSGVLDDLFSVLDANGDERIYYSEFLAATMEKRGHALREETVRATFHRLDADGSGTINSQDLRTVLGETFEGVDVEELVKEADPASNGEISFESFLRILEDREAAVATPSASIPKRHVLTSSGSTKKGQVLFSPEVLKYGGM